MPEADDLNQWLGDDVVDPGGARIGKLTEIYYDRDTDVPLFLGVRTGRLRHHLSLVPVAGSSVGKRYVATDLAKSVIEGAPRIEADGPLASVEEQKLFEYYGLPYEPSLPGGTRLVRH